MAASPALVRAVPSAIYGQFVPPTTSGRMRPTPNPAAIPASPVRHHARYVRSCASAVRWTSPLAISAGPSPGCHRAVSVAARFGRIPRLRLFERWRASSGDATDFRTTRDTWLLASLPRADERAPTVYRRPMTVKQDLLPRAVAKARRTIYPRLPASVIEASRIARLLARSAPMTVRGYRFGSDRSPG